MAQESRLSVFLLILIILQVVTQMYIEAKPPKINANCENCKDLSLCPTLVEDHSKKRLIAFENFEYCDRDRKKVCCERKLPTKFASFAEEECAKHNYESDCSEKYILDGTIVQPGTYPHMVAIGNFIEGKFVSFCTGTLISDKYVLTADHCVNTEERLTSILRLGETDVNAVNNHTQHFSIKDVISYPTENDLALLELNQTASINKFVRPACLPTGDDVGFEKLIVSGWGYIDNFLHTTPQLLAADVRRWDNDTCKLNKLDFDAGTELCAGSNETNADACQGDSGGPLFRRHPVYRCMFMIVGITAASSETHPCGKGDDDKTVGYYTRVLRFNKWIEEIVWQRYD